MIGKTGSYLTALAKLWNERAEILEDRRAVAERVRVDGLVQTVTATRPDLVEAWEQVAASTLAPTALDFRSFVTALLEASLAVRPDIEAEFRIVDELNQRRREHAERDPGGADDLPPIRQPIIQIDPLLELVPDLRGEIAGFDPTVSPEPLRRSADSEVEGLAEAGFGLTGPVGYTNDGNLRLPWRRSTSPEAA